MAEEHEYIQDPFMPPGWHVWQTSDSWHARPPGPPNPGQYVHADTKQACADKAWCSYRTFVDSQPVEQHN